jgi:hypothetical protein
MKDLVIGLNDRARKLLEPYGVLYREKLIRTYVDGTVEMEESKVIGVQKNTYALLEGRGDPEKTKIGLSMYLLVNKEGKLISYHESIQETPVKDDTIYYYLALQDDSNVWVKETLWTKEEMSV